MIQYRRSDRPVDSLLLRATRRQPLHLLIWLVLFTVPAAAQAPPAPSETLRQAETSSASPRHDLPRFNFIYSAPSVPPLPLSGSSRLSALVREGKLYLSLQDAIALAIENNLDVEVSRYELSIADTDITRARGGGTARGTSFTTAQMPVGVGGPGSPLLNSAAATLGATPSTVANVFDVNQLTEAQSNLSLQGSIPFSTGPAIPPYDPSLSGQLAWARRLPATGPVGVTGTDNTPTATPLGIYGDTSVANLTLLQGLSFGTQIQAGINNIADAFAGTSTPDLFRRPNVTATVVQPLLRGFGPQVNRRYIRIAQNDHKISRLLFRQQLNDLAFGITRLYYDLVALTEDVAVRQQTLVAARALYENDRIQAEVGTLAPLELTRVQALVASTELDLTRSQGLLEQQGVILKSLLTRRGTADPLIAGAAIVPMDQLVIPATDEVASAPQLVGIALSNRPDLAQASLQLRNGEDTLTGSRNQVRPQVDLFGSVQTRGSISTSTIAGPSNAPATASSISTRSDRLYEAGIQLGLPLRNRVAQADAARDELQLRQMQARYQLLENQVRAEVEDALAAVRIARTAHEAAVRSRQYQEQLLQTERERFAVGASTNFLIVQDQAALAQARSSEVVARSDYVKARSALDRALGTILSRNNISLDDAIRGELPPR